MSSPKSLFGFHAVGVRLRTAPRSVMEIHFDASRRDARMRQFLERAAEAGVRVLESDGLNLSRLCGSHAHQGVVARVQALPRSHSLDELLEQLEESQEALSPEQRTSHRCCWCSTASPTRTTWAPACAWPTAPAPTR
jgi:23S rRNA (guanosine2251-2'-O)-methyltransferase